MAGLLGWRAAKWSDFRLILDTEPTGFVGRVDVGVCKRLGLANWGGRGAPGTEKAEGERVSEGGLGF